MVNIIYQLFLTLNATSLIIVIFLIKEQTVLTILENFPNWVSYSVFISIPIILTGLSLFLTKFLSDDSIEGGIKELELANNAYLPSYLGYFFVALSVPYLETLIFVFALLFMFTFFSQTLYFNPLFLFWGNHFYYITTDKNVKIFLITKKRIRRIENLEFSKLKRINNFTYIDVEVEKNESLNCEVTDERQN